MTDDTALPCGLPRRTPPRAPSKQATELAFSAGGSASPYAATGLERCLRDIHAATQHATMSPGNYAMAGQALLGLDMSATPLLFLDDRSAE
jgi:hypothetical protein